MIAELMMKGSTVEGAKAKRRKNFDRRSLLTVDAVGVLRRS
jgi:hypothetical protein